MEKALGEGSDGRQGPHEWHPVGVLRSASDRLPRQQSVIGFARVLNYWAESLGFHQMNVWLIVIATL